MGNDIIDFCDSMIDHYKDLSEEVGDKYLEMKNYFYKACEELSYFQAKLYEAERKLYELGYNEYSISDDIKPRDKYEWMGYIMRGESEHE